MTGIFSLFYNFWMIHGLLKNKRGSSVREVVREERGERRIDDLSIRFKDTSRSGDHVVFFLTVVGHRS